MGEASSVRSTTGLASKDKLDLPLTPRRLLELWAIYDCFGRVGSEAKANSSSSSLEKHSKSDNLSLGAHVDCDKLVRYRW